MKSLTRLAALAAASASLSVAARAQTQELDLAVLYAGVEGAPRTAQWLEFLQGNVREAVAVSLAELTAEKAAGYDVVVVDAPSPFTEGGGFEMPRTPPLTREFGTPVILLGAAGGAVLNKMKLKLDWL